MKHALIADRLFDGNIWHTDIAVVIEGHHIVALVSRDALQPDIAQTALPNTWLAPGFIDCQVNGGGDVLFNNAPTLHGIKSMVEGHRATGTTSMLPTVISDTPEVQRAAAEAIRQATEQGLPEVLGIHIEGPFFAPEKRGTHKAEAIRRPNQQDIEWLTSLKGFTTLVTLAPDAVTPAQVNQLTQAGILVSAGHTNASYQQVRDSIDAGLRGFTHLYNAMSPLQAREPGTVGAALTSTDTYVGIIADGHHVHPQSIALAIAARGIDHTVLVTDSMATVGGARKSFELYGETITEVEGRLVNSQGVLSGSAIGMIDDVKYVHQTLGMPLEAALTMASLTPAAFLKLDHKLGRIATGYRADLVALSPELDVMHTWCAGVRTYSRDDSGDQ